MNPPELSEWSPPSSFREFSHQFNTEPQNLFTRLLTLFANSNEQASQYRGERDAARTLLDAANKAIDNLEEQATQLNVDLNIARAGHTGAASTSNAGEPINTSTFRSEKFPDPEKFNGSRAKLPGFITQLRMKLEVNHDRFRNESSKVIYSISRLEGRALDQVVPLVNAKPSAPFSSTSAFIAHLEASFGDPDPRGTARRELVALKQGSGDFADYYSKFLRIIAYLDYNEAAKIDALAEGLSNDLKDAMMYRIEKHDKLEQFATVLMTIDNRIRSRKAEQSPLRAPMGQFSAPHTPHPSHVPGGFAPMDLSALQRRPAPRPPMDQRYTFNNCPSANRPRNGQTTITGALLVPESTNDKPAAIRTFVTQESGFQ